MKLSVFAILVLSLNLTACVSIHLGGKESKPAEGVEFTEPGGPFKEDSLAAVDKGWKNPMNGNSISFISECGTGQDPTLESIRSGVLSNLHQAEILSEDKNDYNSRAALRSHAKGQVDGIESHLDLMIFKKNSCIFILTYVGLTDSFETDRKHFSQFLQGFKAP